MMSSRSRTTLPGLTPSKSSDAQDFDSSKKSSPRRLGVLSALFYCCVSIALISCNKLVMTHFSFPGSLALAASQFLATCLALGILSVFRIIQLAGPTPQTLVSCLPLTVLYLADVVLGLSATGSLSLPMFTVLRRASIPMTMILERCVGQSQPSTAIIASVWGMMLGAAVAAFDDLGFELVSYCVVLANDCLTAARGVYVKSALSSGGSSGRLGKMSLLYYNALLSLLVVLPYLAYNNLVEPVALWLRTASPQAKLAWLASATLGPVLQYAIFLCTQHNSALTTTVVGALKNILTAYVGMFLGDYAFSLLNFIGITISCVASCVYSYAVVIKGAAPSAATPEKKREIGDVEETSLVDEEMKESS